MDNKEEKKEIEFLSKVSEESLDQEVCILFKAMRKLFDTPEMVTNINDTKNIVIERNYVCSLIYQLGRLSTNELYPFSNEVLVGGDMNKYITPQNEERMLYTCDRLNFKISHDKKFEVIPDLIIHGSHDPQSINRNNQYVAVEVKCCEYLGIEPFEKDFFKLNAYLSCLNYKKVIYIILNSEKKRINQRIKQYADNGYFVLKERLNDFFFFVQEGRDKNPEVCVIDSAYTSEFK